MRRDRLAPAIGLAACLAVVVTTAVPYVAVPAQGVDAYYGVTDYGVAVLGPPLVGSVAVLAAVAFGAGLAGYLSPPAVGGTTLVTGVVMVLSAAYWATAVPPSVVMELSRAEILRYHRWALVLFALLVPAAGVWYARSGVTAPALPRR